MANNFTVNPIRIDTAFNVTSFKNAGGLPSNAPLIIRNIYWLNPVNIGDTFVISSDAAGTQVLFTARCEAANQSQVFQVARMISDFFVPTLASGTLYLS